MENHWGSETMLSSNKSEICTFNKPIESLPLEDMSVCMCTQGEGSCRNCCPSNSKGGNPLPGDEPLHKNTRSITTRWRHARKPDKVLRSLHLPASICNTLFYLTFSSICPNSGLWKGRPQQISWTLPSDSGFGSGFKHCRAKAEAGPTLSTQGPVPVKL